jgi:hypothetical protein
METGQGAISRLVELAAAELTRRPLHMQAPWIEVERKHVVEDVVLSQSGTQEWIDLRVRCAGADGMLECRVDLPRLDRTMDGEKMHVFDVVCITTADGYWRNNDTHPSKTVYFFHTLPPEVTEATRQLGQLEDECERLCIPEARLAVTPMVEDLKRRVVALVAPADVLARKTRLVARIASYLDSV